MLFSKISPLTSPIILSCGGLTIVQVESIKYLGIVIDTRLNWDQQLLKWEKRLHVVVRRCTCGSRT